MNFHGDNLGMLPDEEAGEAKGGEEEESYTQPCSDPVEISKKK